MVSCFCRLTIPSNCHSTAKWSQVLDHLFQIENGGFEEEITSQCVCSACGQTGHTKRSKHCPMYHSDKVTEHSQQRQSLLDRAVQYAQHEWPPSQLDLPADTSAQQPSITPPPPVRPITSQPQRRKRHCGQSGQEGHDKRTCPQNPYRQKRAHTQAE